MIETVNIHGKLYVTADEVARFEARAAAGEFAQACGGAAKSA